MPGESGDGRVPLLPSPAPDSWTSPREKGPPACPGTSSDTVGPVFIGCDVAVAIIHFIPRICIQCSFIVCFSKILPLFVHPVP